MGIFDMTTVGKKCGEQGVLIEKLGLECFKKLGMTDACATIWYVQVPWFVLVLLIDRSLARNYDAIYDAGKCGRVCIKDLKKP
jgi:hypothetical protein